MPALHGGRMMMPGFPPQVGGCPINRDKARRYKRSARRVVPYKGKQIPHPRSRHFLQAALTRPARPGSG
jgi:hypothetical protein